MNYHSQCALNMPHADSVMEGSRSSPSEAVRVVVSLHEYMVFRQPEATFTSTSFKDTLNMRSIRTAAVAGATALSLIFGTTVATAHANPDGIENVVPADGPHAPAPEEGATPTLSSKINTGSSMEGDKAANGVALFGSSKDGFEDQPRWAKVMYAGTVLGAIASFIGMIVGPVHNWFVHGPHA